MDSTLQQETLLDVRSLGTESLSDSDGADELPQFFVGVLGV